MKDSYYTPPKLASRLIKFIGKKEIKNVADFCLGDGELLRAAVGKWPKIKCYGTDISERAISSVKKTHKNWTLSKCDFLNAKSRQKTKIFSKINPHFDLILLNPPFSCIGGLRHTVELDGMVYQVSTAMAFLVESIKYLSKDGSLYAILPNSVAYSQKDRAIWNILVEKYKLAILEESNKKHFEGCSPNVILISINANTLSNKSKHQNKLDTNLVGITIFRGKIGMHKVPKKSTTGSLLIHSTNIWDNQIKNLEYRMRNKLSQVVGPAVLIPRVGLPNSHKICVLKGKARFVLSDCVIAIKTQSQQDSDNLKNQLVKNWEDFNELYKGTGARYITVERLKNYLGLKV